MNDDLDPRRLHAFVDDELDLDGRLRVEARMGDDPVTRAQVTELRQWKRVVRDGATYHAAPDDLRSALRARFAPRPRARTWSAWRPAFALVATIAVVALGMRFVVLPARDAGSLADEVVASHVRSTLGEHLIDVASSDHHVVKPWLSSKLDYSPPVGDAKVGTATFVGARLDYVGGRPVAALVYREGPHVAEVYVWPDGASDRPPTYLDDRGFRIAHWTRGGMAYWAISDVDPQRFASFVRAVDAEDGVR